MIPIAGNSISCHTAYAITSILVGRLSIAVTSRSVAVYTALASLSFQLLFEVAISSEVVAAKVAVSLVSCRLHFLSPLCRQAEKGHQKAALYRSSLFCHGGPPWR